MTSAVLERGPVFAPEDEATAIRELEQALVESGATPVLVGADHQERPLPETVASLLVRLVHELARGNAVTIVPVHAELTTFQAAELLNVSRPFLVRLLNEGKIPYHRIGTHRRIYAADLLEFKAGYRKQQRAAVAEMANLAQEMGVYDAAPPPHPDDD
jgi:excisionase family DNA binding protein